MTVGSEELPAGSNLIMGLNPPFGVHASLANKFINKALTFRPKILILIVPRETERLDKKRFPYDLIWEDDRLLTGMSFYLPGSLNVHNQQVEQWNNDTPPLYLWSHRDWTDKHIAIAQKHGHIQRDRDFMEFPSVGVQPTDSNYLMEDNQDCFGDFSGIMRGCPDMTSILDDIPDAASVEINNMLQGHFQAPLECNQNNILYQPRGQSYFQAPPLECNQNNLLYQPHGQSYFQAPLECNQNNIYQSRGNLDMHWQQSSWNEIHQQSLRGSNSQLEMMQGNHQAIDHQSDIEMDMDTSSL